MLVYVAILSAVVLAFVVSWIGVWVVRNNATRIGLLDQPGVRKIHATAIPLGGGIGVWLGVVVTFAIGTAGVFVTPIDAHWLPSHLADFLPGLRSKIAELWVLIGGGSALMLLGLADDRFQIKWQIRLGVEFLVAAFVVYWQGLQLTAFIDSTLLTSLLSVLWIVMLVNSFNMLDNMDGLSGGVAAIASTVLAATLLIGGSGGQTQPQLFVGAMLLVLVGSLLGFLWHNWPPAKIFMGDCGSYFVGYWIAVASLLATYSNYQGGSPFAVLAPVCVLAIPLYDTVSVVFIRLREGRSPFEGDKRHFSHRLVDLGFEKKNAVLTIYLATLTCSLSSMLLPRTDFFGAVIVGALVICILAMVAILEHRHSDAGHRDLKECDSVLPAPQSETNDGS